jgi:D-3-phosphoglycerate dehydrogenase
MEDIWHGILPLRGQSLGIIGFGRIGRALVPKAKGFGLGILAYDPHVPAKIMKEMGVTSVGLHRLLKESDYVSLHCALTDENKHMLGLEQFKLMKTTAYLINSARGTLLDEEALYDALTMGYIAGVGLDALEVEPVNMDNPLLKLENVIFTGHSAHYSDIAIDNIRQSPVDAIAQIMSGKWPSGWVNPQVEAIFVARWGKPK